MNLIPDIQHLSKIKTNPFRFYPKYLFVCLFVHTFANQFKTMGADNKATLEEIEAFLNEFKEKSKVFGIKYDIDKEENFRTLLELEMPGARRDEYIYNLKPEDYNQGPGINDYDPKEGMVWMFGIGIKKRGKKKKIPIYIKIYITKVNGAPNFCISFHEAKFDMVFPYKQEL